MQGSAVESILLEANFEPPNDKRLVCRVKDILNNIAGSEVSLKKWQELLKEDMGYHPAEFDVTCTDVFGKPFPIVKERHLGAALAACEKNRAKFVLTPVKTNDGMFL